jgi:hypothetical protein
MNSRTPNRTSENFYEIEGYAMTQSLKEIQSGVPAHALNFKPWVTAPFSSGLSPSL